MNKGIPLFGIILLVIGLIASFYFEETYEWFTVTKTYPYQGIGIILVVFGILFVGIGCLKENKNEGEKQ